ncbi:MAG: hypothetical protein A2504_10580 [Bdellovibrionales bacterium RIFOXYD12_FULL_39_22]|nr:MAG: hypothetical protein A2385_14215 [Bdellovibrionales bacterium RIFOXYB1_FULL_39_21]OFZ40390.1 MAG: hypothetical protein A2485_02905 [Bdellovibrionales bacterium RIFOXYC12_FULL_39_17]OFZ49639.1 MAG: hypothetical protein A2404_09365 [Bdellovibrionales bacterium RIFOXYC1_FULL_39_130]OFZ74336.1 MAG: hypothetical protein A2451_03680 [Bdellovibrionales bacterium RIFOXYC2_FULL_39_8]OFZ77309.1 MAG: hypothetical protein A2560_06030 [Bdellovibrionales bacterium RIFOXYD1_FULL_39_84]OFZ95964.1 MAG:
MKKTSILLVGILVLLVWCANASPPSLKTFSSGNIYPCVCISDPEGSYCKHPMLKTIEDDLGNQYKGVSCYVIEHRSKDSHIIECANSYSVECSYFEPGTGNQACSSSVASACKPDCEEITEQYVICNRVKYVRELKDLDSFNRDLRKIENHIDPNKNTHPAAHK